MEILFCQYLCKECGTTIEKMHSIHIDVPCKLKVKCPECNKEEIVLLEVRRMVSNDNEEEN